MFSKKDLELIGKGDNLSLVERVCELDQRLDNFFGLSIKKTESSLKSNDPFEYVGLNGHALQTSYLDYFQIFNFIGNNATLVDVGAGYCRGSLLAKHLGYSCISIEVVNERTEKALTIIDDKTKIYTNDITDQKFKIPIGDYYFLYLPQGKVLYQTLKKIKEVAKNKTVKLIVIESHGDVLDYLIYQNEWLKNISCSLKTSTPRHNNNIYVFEVLSNSEISVIQKHWDWNLDEDLEFVIEHDKSFWTADTYDSVIWARENQLHLETFNPKRIITINSIKETRRISKQPINYQKLRMARNNKFNTIHGHIIKIYDNSEKKVEWLNAKFTSWDEAIQLIDKCDHV